MGCLVGSESALFQKVLFSSFNCKKSINTISQYFTWLLVLVQCAKSSLNVAVLGSLGLRWLSDILHQHICRFGHKRCTLCVDTICRLLFLIIWCSKWMQICKQHFIIKLPFKENVLNAFNLCSFVLGDHRFSDSNSIWVTPWAWLGTLSSFTCCNKIESVPERQLDLIVILFLSPHIYFYTATDFYFYFQVKLVNIRNDDITDGNPKLTLGLIWTIILHFQVCASVLHTGIT